MGPGDGSSEEQDPSGGDGDDNDSNGDGDGDLAGDGDGDLVGDGNGDSQCGDGVVDEGEQCDDGNSNPTDGCLSDCTIPPSCAELLTFDGQLGDGFYSIKPESYPGQPFGVYCDMSTDGGGWAVIFKNHGGAHGGARSTEQLLEGEPGVYGGVIPPVTVELESGVNALAWEWYRAQPGHEWLKIGTLWNGIDAVVHEQTIRVDMSEVTWDWILSLANDDPCNLAPSPIRLWANGTQSLGQTDRVSSTTGPWAQLGLATENSNVTCNQPANNLIQDPNEVLYRLDQGDTLTGIRSLFSYVHTAAGQNASRCQFSCWSGDFPDFYDGFTWLVR